MIGGSAVIKNWRLVGWLGLRPLGAFCHQPSAVGLLVVGSPEDHRGGRRHDQIFPHPNQGLACAIGSPSSSTSSLKLMSLSSCGRPLISAIQSIEDLVEQEIVAVTRGALSKLQREFRVDALGLGDWVWKQRPKIWEQVKDDWDDVHFPRAEFQVQSQVRIRRIGVTS